MKSPFILAVTVHLLIDLAMPSLPGAFRFNPDESVMGVRGQHRPAQDLRLAPQVYRLRESAGLPRLETRIPLDPRWNVNAPDLIVCQPRRDPSSEPPPQGLTEDA